MAHKCRRIHRGNYEYRGYIIQCIDYYHPEHRVCWEAYPKNNILCADFHGFSLREVKMAIDYDLDKKSIEDTEKIYTECITAFNKESIIECAERDKETPFGFLLSYLKDMYFLPKVCGYGVTERVLKHFNIK